jgi:hypothetical protein
MLPFPIVSSGRHPNETRGGRRKKRMERCTRSGSRIQYKDPIRMLQADGFTGGVPLTDRISGGSLISKTEGAAEPSPCRRSGRLPRRQPVSQSVLYSTTRRETGAQISQQTTSTCSIVNDSRPYISLYTPYSRHDTRTQNV